MHDVFIEDNPYRLKMPYFKWLVLDKNGEWDAWSGPFRTSQGAKDHHDNHYMRWQWFTLGLFKFYAGGKQRRMKTIQKRER